MTAGDKEIWGPGGFVGWIEHNFRDNKYLSLGTILHPLPGDDFLDFLDLLGDLHDVL